jgi:predicted methyltransferase
MASLKNRKSIEEDHIKAIAIKMNLKEGEEAVRRILREIYRHGKIGTKDLAKATGLPIPVAAAIRRELEKVGLVARKGGAILTNGGELYVRDVLGMVRETPNYSSEFNEELKSILEILRRYTAIRPQVATYLDQAHATPETSLRRACYMLERGDLGGRKVLFLGDDDLTSVAAGLLGKAIRLTVVDIDERVLKVIEEISDKEKLDIETVHHDLRAPLPESLKGVFDTFFTDPPYTVPGLELFLSRGLEAIRKKKTSPVYVAFARKPPLEMLEIHRAIVRMGLFFSELIVGFNEYQGAEVLAGTTSQMRLVVTERSQPAISGFYDGLIYTGELYPKLRIYHCRCGEKIKVGDGENYSTIEELKALGCPHCGSVERFRLIKRSPNN